LQVESCGLQGSREKRETPLKNGFFGNFNHFVKYLIKNIFIFCLSPFVLQPIVSLALLQPKPDVMRQRFM
jgi:hypothetical protein